jgi:hypothetical protein
MSKITYRHKEESTDIKNGKITVYEEDIIDGPKGVSFKLYKKTDTKKEKIIGRRNDDGTYTFIHIVDDKKDSKNLSLADLLKEIKKIKGLEFAVKYLSTAKMARASRALSRSGSRKGSKKRTSRKGSKKRTSRKGSKKRTSRKGSKKRTSRKGSRKAVKRSSKRRSRK